VNAGTPSESAEDTATEKALDQFLWNRQLLSTLCRPGSLNTAQSQNSLLATVAKTTHQSQKPDEAGRSSSGSSCVWHYQQRPMAQLKNTRDKSGIIQCLFKISGVV